MVYNEDDKKKMIEDALKAIKEYNLLFLKDLFAFMPISRQTFYNYKFDEVDEIKDALMKNKAVTRHSLLGKWYKSDVPVTQIALMKLIGDEEDYHRLSGTKMDITSREEKAIFKGIDLSDARKAQEEDDS